MWFLEEIDQANTFTVISESFRFSCNLLTTCILLLKGIPKNFCVDVMNSNFPAG